MKNCNSCGHKNEPSMRFCVDCGAVLDSGPQMVVPLVSNESVKTDDYENPTVVSTRQTVESGSYLKYAVFAVIGVGLILVVGAAGIAAAIALSIYNAPQKTPIAKRDYPTPYPTPVVRNTPRTLVPNRTPTPGPTPSKYVTTPVSPIGPASKRGSFTIKANQKWQISKIRTVGSQNFRVVAFGTYKLSGIRNRVSARGVSGHIHRRIFKQYKTGALLMRTHYPDGSHSNIQPVAAGQYWQNYPKERGLLEFIVNDNRMENNSGSLRITFRSTS